MSSRNNVHFSIDVYDEAVYKKAQEKLAKGDLQLLPKLDIHLAMTTTLNMFLITTRLMTLAQTYAWKKDLL